MKSKSSNLKAFMLFYALFICQFAFNQAPQWVWNSPLAIIPSSVGGTGLSIYAMLDRPGTIYYVVLSHGAAAPSVAQIAAGKDASNNTPILSGGIALSASEYKSGFKSIEIKPLASSTEFDVYLAAKDTAASPHFQSSPVLLDLTTLTGSGLNYWNGGFEQWNDSLTVPLYYYSWRQTLPNYQTYSRSSGESGYGLKTTVTNTSLANKVVLDMQEDPYAFGLSNGVKYHFSLRLKSSRANAFSVAFKTWAYFTDFGAGSGNPSAAASLNPDTLKSTGWHTYSYDFTITSANRFKARWNVNKTGPS